MMTTSYRERVLRRFLFATVAALATGFVAGESLAAEACPPGSGERPWMDRALTPECRADALVARLGDVDTKLKVLADGFNDFGVDERGASDGPAGPTHAPGAASLPNGLALAASFDPALAADYGAVVGREFRFAGLGRMLGPTVDVARTWRAGRVPEGLGEDPLLSARMAAPLVRSIQAQGVAVTLKHFAVYAQEQGRTGDLPFGERPAVDNVVSERAIREIYLPPFRAAVEEGGALGAMCAFPRINGVYACENSYLLGILRDEWKFRGTVTPDFPDAQRSVIAAVNAGLDGGNFGLPRTPPKGAGGPGGPPGGAPDGGGLAAAFGLNHPPGGIDLATAVKRGEVGQARLDDMLRRRLVAIFATDDGPASDAKALGGGEALALGLRTTEQGAVLLRNEKGLLPFGMAVKSVALIGVQAGDAPQVSTPGSAYVEPKHLVTVREALSRRPGVSVVYEPGSLGVAALPTIPAEVLRAPGGALGLRADYVANPNLDFTGPTIATREEPTVDLRNPAPIAGLPPFNGWSTRWTGTLTPRISGVHHLTIAGSGSGRLYLNDKLVARFDRVDFGAVEQAAVKLQAGKPATVRVEFTPREAAPLPGMAMMGTSLGVMMQLGWAEPDDRIAKAVAAAKAADVAVVFAADRHGEGADRVRLGLPADQVALIEAVSAANPRTVVVLNTAGPVSMPWAGKVSSILEMWYPGDALGQAAARLLFGDAAPGGRLPITFPANEGQGPASATRNYPGVVDASGALDKASFDEGVLVGYRWFDAKGEKPLFPFGHGLTYAPITFDKVVIADQGGPHVDVTVRNGGARPDQAVVQVYLSSPAPGEPPKRLAAFEKITLAGGETRTVRVDIPASSFAEWDDARRAWRAGQGSYGVLVGRSSADIVQRGAVTAPGS
jgi:beta-glucosidase